MSPATLLLLADLVLLLHAAFALFIGLGLAAIGVGGALGWGWVRRPGFRYAHLAAMAIVLLESCLGWACPLTEWEDALRQAATQAGRPQGSWMQQWVGRLLYYEASETTFLWLYAWVFVAILLGWWLVPVESRRRCR